MHSPRKPLAVIVAIADGGVIGHEGKLPWRIAEDMREFRRLTEGHAVIMGRRTHESIGRALPNRRNLVVTNTAGYVAREAEAVTSYRRAVELAREGGDALPFVIGGVQVYRAAMQDATVIYLTEIRREVPGDTFLQIDRSRWREVEHRQATTEPDVSFLVLERR